MKSLMIKPDSGAAIEKIYIYWEMQTQMPEKCQTSNDCL